MRPTLFHLSLLMLGFILLTAVGSFKYMTASCEARGGELVREPLEWVCVKARKK